ncbi:MAG: hypothetical protein KBB55_00775 [Candidatus Buchananbacteria bacterium]|nr:hypothetical protein [Candidatus Buchananbacteria bacterium]
MKSYYWKLGVVVVIGVTGFLLSPLGVRAQMYSLPDASIDNEYAAQAAIAECELTAAEGLTCNAADCTVALSTQLLALKQCLAAAEKANASLVTTNAWTVFLKDLGERQLEQERRAAWANIFKTTLGQFSQRLAYDTATWIASGGKGQQPLFITEGWGAYLQNTADQTIGTFIGSIDKEFGTNLCEPKFGVKIPLIRGLDPRAPRAPRCTFSTFMNNWEQAVTNPQFTTEYVNFLQPGENDISSFLILQTGLGKKQDDEFKASLFQMLSGQGYKDVTNFVGKILTPGTFIREQYGVSQNKANTANEVFTGTVWDFVQTFLDTLTAKLISNLQAGFFSDSASGGSGSGSNFRLPNLSGLLNPDASPYTEGSQGAAERFSNLVENQGTVTGPYDILNKLLQCSDAAKTNLGPTDCVIDNALALAIRNKTLVKNLPAEIKNRRFAPPVNTVSNPQTELTRRNVTILRKYRIVPVGWDVAAKKLSETTDQNSKIYTLGELVEAYNNSSSPFYQLINPNWVLKAPELFCRREGFGDKNDFANSQDNTVRRASYCADEQQCLKEDENGKCISYGYCTEERRNWNFGTKVCNPVFNSCRTYTTAGGANVSYLANTLDYRDCNAQNAGCRWYSLALNPVDNTWLHTAPEQLLVANQSVAVPITVQGGDWRVREWHNRSGNGRVVMEQQCTPATCTADQGCTFQTDPDGSRYCSFGGASCTVAVGGIRCPLTTCTENQNILSGSNADFARCDSELTSPDGWNTTGSAEHTCALGVGRNNNAFELTPLTAGSEATTTSATVTVEPNSQYSLSFWAWPKTVTGGTFTVRVKAGTVERSVSITATTNTWQEYAPSGETPYLTIPDGVTTAQIEIVSDAAASGSVLIDDISLKKVASSCAARSVYAYSSITETKADKEIYFDRDVQQCQATAAGCSEFIRTAPGLGSNLLPNASFEIVDPTNADEARGWLGAGRRSTERVRTGNQSAAVNISANAVEVSSAVNPAVRLEANQRYALSAWVYSTVTSTLQLKLKGTNFEEVKPAEIQLGSWQRVSLVVTTSAQIDAAQAIIDVSLTPVPAGYPQGGRVYIDDVKLEAVTAGATGPSEFSSYESSTRPPAQIANLKKAPDYYQCYLTDQNNQNSWPQNRDQLNTVLQKRTAQCGSYAQVCTPQEVGCELYTPTTGGNPAVPGRVTSADFCPVEIQAGKEIGICDGYQVYKQETSSFSTGRFTQFIANNTPKYCSAAAAGCDEFTNLDAATQGGEQREYYTELRLCQKPGGDDANYYTWEGSDTTGYQLKAFTLKRSTVKRTEDTSATPPCTFTKYNNATGASVCADADPAYTNSQSGYCAKADIVAGNSDCREFYDINGDTSYRLLSHTVTSSNNCHPYRRTQTQVDLATAKNDCENTQGFWNATNECVYQAIPREGKQCSAAVKGCREYTGNRGNNLRNVFSSTFETGVEEWKFGTLSNEASYPGGVSLQRSGGQLVRPVTITKNKAYTLTFWAKAASTTATVEAIRFGNSPNKEDYFASNNLRDGVQTVPGPITLTSEWKQYSLGPVFVTWGENTFVDQLELDIQSGTVFIDTVTLKEVQQKVYLVENSWFTPIACDNKYENPTGTNSDGTTNNRLTPGEMIGCVAYRDRTNATIHVKSFDRLCRPEAVGCEALLDTHNSDSAYEQEFNTDEATSAITVPADNLIYLVNDKKYSCAGGDKGCTAVGLPKFNADDELVTYDTVYLKNQPDRYGTDLCRNKELWCEEFKGGTQTAYFKDPRSRVCEYKQVAGASGWVKRGTTEPCEVTEYQTIGQGQAGGVKQPIGWFDNLTGTPTGVQPWAGMCPAAQNSCSEFIDPLGPIYNSTLLNGDFESPITTANWYQIDSNPVSAAASAETSNDTYVWAAAQNVRLQANKLYTLSARVEGSVALAITCGGTIWSPDDSMNNGQLIASGANTNTQISGRFYVGDRADACRLVVRSRTLTPGAADPNLGKIYEVSLVPTGVYYALGDAVDRRSCNSLADINNGCILVNDRSQLDYAQTDPTKRTRSTLRYDTDATYQKQLTDPDQKPVSVEARDNEAADSNTLIKVTPDRTCAAWLQCTTYEKDSKSTDAKSGYGNFDRCLDISLCTSLGENGECNQLAPTPASPTIETYGTQSLNKTGYSIIDLLPFAQMTQTSSAATVINGNFESVFGKSSEPIGWRPYEGESTDSIVIGVGPDLKPLTQPNNGWTADRYSVIYDPKNTLEGSSYVRVNTKYHAISDPIDVEPGKTYTLTAWINTLDLKPADSASPAKAEILMGYGDNSASCSASPVPCIKTELQVAAGQNWTKVTSNFTTPANARELTLTLTNFRLGGDVVSGFSRFDAISIKPVLKVDDQRTIDRSCRVYPAQDAASCQYINNNNVFYGLLGYCLTRDPQNSKQCLQWWPIDQLSGESQDEISSYNAQRPLYYCVNKGITQVNVGANNALVRINTREGSGLQSLDSGKEVHVVPLEINNGYRALMRYPYVSRLDFGGVFGMIGSSITGGVGVRAQMWNNKVAIQRTPIISTAGLDPVDMILSIASQFGLTEFTEDLTQATQPEPQSEPSEGCGFLDFGCYIDAVGGAIVKAATDFINGIVDKFTFKPEDRWGGWGMKFAIIQDMKVLIFLPWHGAVGIQNDPLVSVLAQTGILGVDGGSFGMKIITDQDSQYKGKLTDPTPGITGDILGVAWFMDSATDSHVKGAGMIGGISAKLNLEYCSEIVQVVTAAGTNKAWTGRLSSGSMFTSLDNDCVLDSEEESPVTTYAALVANFPAHCAIKESGPYTVKGYKYSTDYKPFGAIVPPSTGQYPYNWDSKDAIGVQPLFYEIADPSKPAPGQSRMGQTHTVPNLQRLFAKTYGVWRWDRDNSRYVQDANSTYSWNPPTQECQDQGSGRRPPELLNGALNPGAYCYVKPTVTNLVPEPRTITSSGAQRLSFNVTVDPEQLPLRSYTIYWGDTTTVMSGASLRDRANAANPFVMYHFYDYRKLVAQDQPGTADGIDCSGAEQCKVTVRVEVRDNWGIASGNGQGFVPVVATTDITVRK